MPNTERYWVWLSSIPTIGAIKSKNLLDVYKDPQEIWHATRNDLKRHSFLTEKNIENILDEDIKNNAQNTIEKMYKYDITMISITDPDYPHYLKNIYDPPVVIYKKGTMKSGEKFIALVGSRRASKYGFNVAQNLSSELAKRNITVVSGMAKGIDSCAHKGALNAGGRTIAVLGCGLDVVYPLENKELMQQILNNGAVLSEYVPGVTPVPQNFPARNRIISGLSLGVVVIEANLKSGSLITVNFALEQGREVFAVPGNINSECSLGTNKLIKDGAKIVTNIDDILEEINALKDYAKPIQQKEKININSFIPDLNQDERKIVECLAFEQLYIDAISEKCDLNINIVSSLLIVLELRGIIEQLPGKIFKLTDL